MYEAEREGGRGELAWVEGALNKKPTRNTNIQTYYLHKHGPNAGDLFWRARENYVNTEDWSYGRVKIMPEIMLRLIWIFAKEESQFDN